MRRPFDLSFFDPHTGERGVDLAAAAMDEHQGDATTLAVSRAIADAKAITRRGSSRSSPPNFKTTGFIVPRPPVSSLSGHWQHRQPFVEAEHDVEF